MPFISLLCEFVVVHVRLDKGETILSKKEREPILPAIILDLWQKLNTHESQFIQSSGRGSSGRHMKDEAL